jgi:hypothetical protein
VQLRSLAYTSRARLDLDEADLRDIHQASRHLNALDGITGLLLFDGTRFMQIIEGAYEAIDNLVERLRRDDRHTAFEIRDDRVIEARAFPDWSMELVRVSSGYRDAVNEIESVLPGRMPPAVRDLALKMAADASGQT